MEERARYAVEVEKVMCWKEGRIQVLLVDSDPIWQQRLEALIDAEPDMNISHIATNKESAIRASIQLDLDVMILDLVLHQSLLPLNHNARKLTELPVRELTNIMSVSPKRKRMSPCSVNLLAASSLETSPHKTYDHCIKIRAG